MRADILIHPTIFRDDSLNIASCKMGSSVYRVYGSTKTELYKAIRNKIWAMSGEAEILDTSLSKDYNKWCAEEAGLQTVPDVISNFVYANLFFALPYSDEYKRYLRGYEKEENI